MDSSPTVEAWPILEPLQMTFRYILVCSAKSELATTAEVSIYELKITPRYIELGWELLSNNHPELG